MSTPVEDSAVGVASAAAIRAAFEHGEQLESSRGDVDLVLDGSRPFLVVVREAEPASPLARLVQGEAAYLRAGPDGDSDEVRATVRHAAAAGVAEHGAFLVLELWAGDRTRVLAPDGPAPAAVRALEEGLADLAARADETVEVTATTERQPPGLDPLMSVSDLHELGALLVGVELRPRWHGPEGELYPVYLRRLASDLSAVLRNAAFEFLRAQAGTTLASYRALGRRSLGDAVWEADRRLAGIDASFDLLLLVAPVDARSAWERFRDGGYQRAPEFHYRLLPVEPDLLKRELYDVRLEDVQDPAAWTLLHDKREELDKQISLIAERNTPAFVHGSIRLFGTVDAALRDRAEEILEEVPPPGRALRVERVSGEEFAALVRVEFDHYRARWPEFESDVQVRPDLVGLMVSSGRLLIGQGLSLHADRVEALLQHEVGTHILTFVNGSAQPFEQLARGFADYDELQEGLGVLAEYLVGGLTRSRLRLLAARVVTVDCLVHGAGFVEAFRRLRDDHGFSARGAFDIVTRVYAGGGFTRGLIYLRGLRQVVEYLRDGGPLEPLYVGKIAARHLPAIQELRERDVLAPTPLLPAFLDRDDVRYRLRRLREGLPIHRMVSD
jgi:uncharacterized protein (TIGR02421 family)